MSDTESVSSQGEALLRGSAPSANMFEETVERLGHSIKLGLIKPGQQLPPERELAELIGVSRVTVRSALQVLVQGGFLIAKRGRNGGTFVVDHPPVWNGTNSERPNSHVSASDAAAFSDFYFAKERVFSRHHATCLSRRALDCGARRARRKRLECE